MGKKTQKEAYDFSKPKNINDATLAFPAKVVGELLPLWDEIPNEFKRYRANVWVETQIDWFFKGLPKNVKFYPKEGINPEVAFKHLLACQRSFEPKHEHKEAGVAYLMSLWFDKIEYSYDPS